MWCERLRCPVHEHLLLVTGFVEVEGLVVECEVRASVHTREMENEVKTYAEVQWTMRRVQWKQEDDQDGTLSSKLPDVDIENGDSYWP